MITEQFTILHDANGVFTNHSFALKTYDGDTAQIDLIAATSRLLIGLDKPFNVFYPEMKTANTNAGTFTAKYFDKNDVAFKALTIDDNSKMFTQSGFVTWDKPRTNSDDNLWEASTEDGIKKFWLELVPSVDFSSPTVLQGLNIVFSDDADLIRKRSNIVSKHATNQPTGSWILKHQDSRDEIIQMIRNQGNKKIKTSDIDGEGISLARNITQFDFLAFEEIRQASKYYVLADIFRFELSDKEDDKYEKLGIKFQNKGNQAFEVFFLSLDKNDDGIDDLPETLDEQTINLNFN